MQDAQVLFDNGRWRGAMYLAGYAVECRLKYKLMRRWKCFNLEELEARLARRGIREQVITHNLDELLRLAGGRERLRDNGPQWSAFSFVNLWHPAWRYSADPAKEDTASRFLTAVTDLLRWIDNHL
jgi:HEPN domain-containing protein